MSRTKTVEVATSTMFDHMLDARQRLRTLVIDTDPEQATWQTSSVGHPAPPRPANPDRTLALALLGVHDLIEWAISEHIAGLRDLEDTAEEADDGPHS